MRFSDVPSTPYDDLLLLSTLAWEPDLTISRAVSEPTDPLQSFIRLLGWKYPTLRVLQVGAGDTTITRAIIHALQPGSKERLYSKFIYAITRNEGKEKIREETGSLKAFEVVPLDMAESGLEALVGESLCDFVILSSEFIKDLQRLPLGFNELRQLLRPHGHLLVHNACNQEVANSELTHLAENLSKAGFTVGSVLSLSGINASFFTGRLLPPPEINFDVELLVDKSGSRSVAQRLEKHFIKNGVQVTLSTKLGASAKPAVISLLDLDKTSVFSIDEAGFRPLIDSLTKFQGPIIWLVPPCQASCTDPRAAMMIGLARTIRQEYNTDLTVVEVDAATLGRADFPSLILSLYRSLANRDRFGGTLNPDYEYAVIDGIVKVPRLHWFGLSDEASVAAAAKGTLANAVFKEKSSYLLIGGLGGLGRAVATWMVENGARSLLFLSRSASDGRHEPFVIELESQGCKVQLVPGSVTDASEIRQAIGLAGPSLAGVMQMSMVLRDNSLATMTFPEWDTCIKPKVQGTFELHKALTGIALDFFVMFSSGSGIGGQHGQANYNAANTFLDAFAHSRHAQGLPASVIDIGVMDDIGAVAQSEQMADIFRNTGHTFLREQDLLNGLSIAIASQQAGPRSQLILGVSTDRALSDPTNRTIWKRDVRMGVAHQFDRFSQADGDTGSGIQTEYADIRSLAKNHPEKLLEEDTLMVIARSIGSALSSLLVRPIDDFMLADPLDTLGLDSVVAIELLSWLQRSFRVGFMTLEIIQCSSLLNLAEQVARRSMLK
ncbi:hypothetical protein EKO04_003962 [Ascochyta lentis]|uniref:Carrier domain-containing protein n=1 Tax=Ascochyta lentis TaxID=205686 RepID=A0A8H7J5U7_9PLEO|nr:hypothetical protein EKO04_003962 [Ascochyta lentis]